MEDAKEAFEGEEGETLKKKKKHASPRSLRIKNHRSKGLKDVYHNSSSNLYNTLKSIPRHSPLAHKERTLSLSIGDLEETDEERERKKDRKESSSQIVTAKERKSGKEKRRGKPGILSTSDPSSSAESLSAWMSSDSSSDDSNSDSDYELDPSWVKDEFEEEDRRLWMETHGRKREEDSLMRSRSLSPPAREPQASPHTQDKLFSNYQNLNKGGIIEDLLARAKKPSAAESGTNSGKEGKEGEGDEKKSKKDRNPIIEVTQASSEGQVLLYSRNDNNVHKQKKKKSIDEMIKATRTRSTSVPPPTLKRRATIANFPTKLSVPSPKKSSSQGSVVEEEDEDKENDREFRSSSPVLQKTQERRQKRRSADSGGLRSLSARSLRKNVHAGENEGNQEREKKKKRNGIFRTRSLSLRRWQIMGKEKKAKDAEEKQRGRRGRSWTLGSRGSTSLSPRDRNEPRANSKSPTKGEK